MAVACVIGGSVSVAAAAQDYPAGPVTMVVTFSKGSATDVFARMIGRKLSEIWGRKVVVQNIAGGGGSHGADSVAKSAPDGYTLLFNSSAHVTNGVLYSKLPYDPIRDFYPVAPIATQPFVLVAGPASGVKNVSELVLLAKARPGQIKFGSAGVGSSTHFCAEKFRIAVGIDVMHVPFTGAPEATAATVSGIVTYWLMPVSEALKPVREGRLVALGVASANRSNVLPHVPTMAQAGVRIEDSIWFGMWAPAGIPDAVADKIVRDVARATGSPDVREKIIRLGAEPLQMNQAEFARFVRTELETADRIMKVTGIKPFPR
jgi:tripartite-type tricarboxylate transporter receptor subunit TctC